MAPLAHRRHPPPRRERSLAMPGLLLLAAFVTLCGAILAFQFAPAPELLFRRNPAEVNLDKLIHVSFEDGEVIVPDAFVDRIRRRMLGSVQAIHLQIPWPFGGAASFARAGDAADLAARIYLAFEPRKERNAPDQRFDRIYARYLLGGPIEDEAGLLRYEFKPDSPYAGMLLYVGAGEGGRVMFRCEESRRSGAELCERQIPLNERILVRYRMHRSLLPAWRDIEGFSRTFIAGIFHSGAASR